MRTHGMYVCVRNEPLAQANKSLASSMETDPLAGPTRTAHLSTPHLIPQAVVCGAQILTAESKRSMSSNSRQE